jgi:HEAT repeat protein
MLDQRDTHLVAPLHGLLDHTDLLVRLSAIEALGAIRSESSVSVLLTRFSESSQVEKAQMAHALGRIGHQSALPALRVYLDEVQAMDHSIPRKEGVRGSDPHPDALEIIVDEAINSIEANNA